MSLLGFFRGKAAIRDEATVARFVDENAAFLVQKGIYEYSRARAGHYAKVMFREEGFRVAVELARWRAYPLGLLIVAELVDGAIHGHAAERTATLNFLSALVLRVFDSYSVPAALGEQEWASERVRLAQRLQQIGMHPAKRAMDVPEQWAQTYFDLMPIHEKLRVRDLPTMRNYLRVTVCNIHDEFVKRLDRPSLVESFQTQT